MQLILGDCVERMKELPDNSIDAVVTDPPYHLVSINKRFGKSDSAPAKYGTDGRFQRLSGGFMGKQWDGVDENGMGIAYSVAMWSEVLRVLKPGGHLLSFGGTRTYHRMACAIEDAGFEIRDQIQWLYGSGFPKSYNISKGIDKMMGAEREVVGQKNCGYQVSISKTRKEQGYRPNLTTATELVDITAPATPEAQQWDGWGSALKPANEIICLAEKPLTLCGVRDIIVENLLRLEGQLWSLLSVSTVEKNFGSSRKEYEGACASAQWTAEERQHTLDDLLGRMDMSQLELAIITILNIALSWQNILDDLSKHSRTFTTEMESGMITDLRILNSSLLALTPLSIILDATNPDGKKSHASTVAGLFSGVNTKLNYILTTSALGNATSKDALKNLRPNSSPICLARKPLSEKNIVENVLKWGTGGINIDDCRIELNGEIVPINVLEDWSGFGELKRPDYEQKQNNQGRFPANVIMDSEAGALLDEQSGKSKSVVSLRGSRPRSPAVVGDRSYCENSNIPRGHSDKGGASRFFYCAKASRKERNAGLEEVEPKWIDTGRKPDLPDGNNLRNRGARHARNHHPTVKPISLMRYLCRLITPPNGTVLDPFMGSGTTGCAAVQEGFDFVGIEQDAEYIEIARRRIEYWGKDGH